MKQWDEVKSEFEIDGALRDIYVENIDLSIWNLFIKEIKQSAYKIEFTHGDETKDVPDNFKAIEIMQSTEPTILSVWVSENIQLNCHFFTETEIELDVSPCDVQDEKSYSHLISFLEWLAILVGYEAKLTHENMKNQVIFSVGKQNI